MTLQRRSGTRQLLARIFDDARLVETVRGLEAGALARLVAHVGLEDAGELVALATPAQLQRVLDEDVWRSPRPGEAERFDAERFLLWLEVMLEATSADRVAERLTELPEELLTLALQQAALVVDLEALAAQSLGADDDAQAELDKALDSVLYHELGGYQLIARRQQGWDALVAVLAALDERDHDFLDKLLARLAHASAAFVEDHGGLHAVLSDAETLEADAAAEREERRAVEGYVAPSDAAAFLALARATPLEAQLASHERDPLTRAYFRAWKPAPHATPAAAAAPEWVRLVDTLDAPPAPRPRLAGDSAAREPLMTTALRRLSQADEALAARRLDELAYLTNVLVAGCAHDERALRPFEAVEAALGACSLGLEAAEGDADAHLRTDGADKWFRVGWHLLHRDLVTAAAHALAPRLAAAKRPAPPAAKPWLARRHLAALGVTPLDAWRALLDECPAPPTPTARAS